MQYNLYGNLEQWTQKKAGVLTSNLPTRSVSVNLEINPAPDQPVARRRKPTPSELIWNGVDYNKSRRITKYGQVRYLTAYDPIGYGRESDWTVETTSTSSANIHQPRNGSWLAADPLDPMNQLIGKMRSQVANFGEMLGEYDKTAKLFNDTVVKVIKSFKQLRRRDLRGVQRTLKGVGQASFTAMTGGSAKIPAIYLHWKFGVMTLIQDLHESCEELKNGVQSTPPVSRISVRKTNDVSENLWTPLDGRANMRNSVSVSRVTRQLIAYYEVDNTLLKSAADHGLTNPVSLAYELYPFSWFVDYLFDVGSWLQALDFPSGIGRTVCYETVTRMETQTLTDYTVSPGWNSLKKQGLVMLENPVTTSVRKHKYRQKRILKAVAPQFKPKPSTGHILNSLAALMQLKVR